MTQPIVMEKNPYQQSLLEMLPGLKNYTQLNVKLVQFIQTRVKRRHWCCLIVQDESGTFYSINSGTKKWRIRKPLNPAEAKRPEKKRQI